MKVTTYKVCNKCGEEKPATLEHFYKEISSSNKLRTVCKDCNSEAGKRWQERNLEHRKKYQQEYREINREAIKQRDKEYRQKNKEHINKYSNEYYEKHQERYPENRMKNRESINARMKKYREENKEIINAKMRKYRKTPQGKESQAKANHKRMALKKELPSTLTVKQWRNCKEHFNHSCAYCGKPSKRLHQEHFVALSNGGGYVVNNIVPSCQPCNNTKFNHSFFEWYPKQKFYSKARERKLLKYLNFTNGGEQQASIFEIV